MDLPLREAAGVSGECMNRVYDMLRQLDNDHLDRMWCMADPFTPAGALLRHQIAFVLDKRKKGHWRNEDFDAGH